MIEQGLAQILAQIEDLSLKLVRGRRERAGNVGGPRPYRKNVAGRWSRPRRRCRK